VSLLIVNADDFGLTEKVSEGIIDAHRRGIVTSTSVLAVTDAFASSMKMLQEAPMMGVGVHFAAVGEDPPVLSAKEIPTLVNKRGLFHSSWRTLIPSLAAGRVNPDDLRKEFAAQFEKVAQAGFPIDHVDTHQNIHLWPMVADVVFSVAAEHSVSAIRVTRTSSRGPFGQAVGFLVRRLDKKVRENNFRTTEAMSGFDEAGDMGTAEIVSVLRKMATQTRRSFELAVHPGLSTDIDRAKYRWKYRWGDEHDALISVTVRAAIEQYGFTLGRFSDLP
jgi:predicted glycoside hydrolase/deacetylase ChbG (UPF0249 family)